MENSVDLAVDFDSNSVPYMYILLFFEKVCEKRSKISLICLNKTCFGHSYPSVELSLFRFYALQILNLES
jgi:hypothetical protein